MEDNQSKVSFITKLIHGICSVGIRIAIFLVLGFRFHTDKEVKAWKRSKKSFLIMSAHPSEMDAVIMLCAGFPRYTRYVVGAQQLYKGFQGKCLQFLKVIPKKQFTSDVRAIKDMIRTVKNGYVLGMMPEGRVSMDGTPSPIDESTGKLIKKLAVPVAVLLPHGTYFVKPPYKSDGIIRGKISGELKALFSEQDVAEMSAEELTEKLAAALDYNACEELRGTGRKYGSKKKPYMVNVANLFYRCPKCGKLYTIESADDHIRCTYCGMETAITQEMFFSCDDPNIPDNIAAWNKGQLEFEHEYWKDPEASISFDVKKAFMILGKDSDFGPTDDRGGVLKLDPSGMHYSDEDEALDIPLHAIPGVSADYQRGFIAFYQDNLIRRFYLENIKYAARFVNSLMVLKGLK